MRLGADQQIVCSDGFADYAGAYLSAGGNLYARIDVTAHCLSAFMAMRSTTVRVYLRAMNDLKYPGELREEKRLTYLRTGQWSQANRTGRTTSSARSRLGSSTRLSERTARTPSRCMADPLVRHRARLTDQ